MSEMCVCVCVCVFMCVHTCLDACLCICISKNHHLTTWLCLLLPRGEEEVAHGMKVWRKALLEVRSAAQLAMCLQQLQKSIAWERSIMKVVSQTRTPLHTADANTHTKNCNTIRTNNRQYNATNNN